MNKTAAKVLKLNIRPMKSSDIEKIIAIEKDCFPDPWPRSAFESIIDSPDHGARVTLFENKIVAYSCYLIIANEAHLTNLAVAPEFRRKSVARLLLAEILEIAQRKECEYILLEVRPRNESAISFYEQAGFKLLYRRPRYYRNPVEDALVMVYYFPDNEKK